ncbi:MAG TPA: ABC transporter ATP-binding protein [Cyclobacteriaceae bacterium]|jgi:ABC-2 type transport system ATP-binding protein|nr:ABC transporter ATP-binding protein [Cyclobacteriaceae bacterium]
MLHLSGVQKKYSQRVILDIPDLKIDGGIHWLKGSNGSGKSTFLKMISGIIPFEGTIELDNTNLKKNGVAYRRLVSYAEAEPLYPDFLTGEDLIRFYNSVRKSDPKYSNALIEKFGISGYYKNPIGTYSSGMAKKLSLVLAFIGKTKFILLDEPFVTLDVATVQVLIDTIKEFYQQERNFIFTSHQSPEMNALPLSSEMIAQNDTVCFQQ